MSLDRCPACRGIEFPFDSAMSLGDYHGGLRRWVIDAKHNCDPLLVAGLARMMVRGLQAGAEHQAFHRVVPVPSRGRWGYAGPGWLGFLRAAADRWLRGDRGRLPFYLAERISLSLGLPLSPNLVQYHRFTRKQGRLDQRRRWRNVSGAMRVSWVAARWISFQRRLLEPRLARWTGRWGNRVAETRGVGSVSPWHPLAGESILVVDDVMTTGATLAEVTRVLKQLGAKEVHAIVLARATARQR
ncbi:MAG: ComF family protein [Planctomycetales bacterium]|nr:ComF family protein [Planctomycetales bacterium]